MKISNEILVNSVNVLNKLNKLELGIKVGYKLAKNIKNIEKELVIYDKEKQKLINKYAEKNDDNEVKVNENGTINILDADGWNKDYKELLEIENDIKLELIKIDDLDKIEFKITPGELTLIDYLLK